MSFILSVAKKSFMLSVVMLNVVMLNVVSPSQNKLTAHSLREMHYFQKALAYFATVISYTYKMFMKLTPMVNFINILQA